MLVAALFGHEQLKLPIETITKAILLVQFVGVIGPFLFSPVARAVGIQRAILISLACWILILFYAYARAQSVLQFFVMAGAAAIAMGGTEALSRTLFANMIPRGKEAEFFSLREVAISGTSWVGPLSFGLALQFTQSYRVAIVSLMVFFVAGALTLRSVNVTPVERPDAATAE